jgi:hypothetical protein
VFRAAAHSQNAGGNARVERLYAAIEHLRKSGYFRNLSHGNAGVANHAGGAARRDNLGAEGVQLPREFDDAGFIGDTDEDALDLGHLRAR